MFTLRAEYGTGWVYVAAKTWKEARKYAQKSDYLSNTAEEFIDYRGHLFRDKENKFVFTEDEGELDIEQIIKNKIHWFTCYECDSDNVSLVKESIDSKFKCNECGEVFDIPYYDD
jgi:formylmethanofuran dehydrogenase subunit E